MLIARQKSLQMLGVLRHVQQQGIRSKPKFGYAVQRNINKLEAVEKAFNAAMSGPWDDVFAANEKVREDILAANKREDGQLNYEQANIEWLAHIDATPELKGALKQRADRSTELNEEEEDIDFYLVSLDDFPDDLDVSLYGILAPMVKE